MKNLTCIILFFVLFSSCRNDNEVYTEDSEIEDPIEETTSSSPNILLIIADDMGLDATPGYNIGALKPSMPTLTSLMNAGIKFNNVWSNPTCTPTRGTIITGKYGFRTGVTQVDDVLSTSETSLQTYMTTNGASEYETAVIGKWHLGRSANHPNNMGIDYYAGVLGGGVQSYWNWPLTINGSTTNSTEYTTIKFTDLAIDWIDNQTQPWFLWLAYNAPHTPFHLPPNDLHSQGNLPSDDASIAANPLPYYLAMIEAMDTEMGRLIASMSQTERDNTIIIFIGDNGTPGQVVQEHTRFRAKGSVYQGGVNVPMVISGKNVIRINEVDNSLINTTDLFSTIANMAGVGATEINDSKSFFDVLTLENTDERVYTFAQSVKQTGDSDYAIRNETHKYIEFANGTEALYDLSENPLENPNLMDSTLSDGDNAIKNLLINKLGDLLE